MGKINTRQIIILWALVIAAYAAVILLANPLLFTSQEQQHEIYEAVVEYLCVDRFPAYAYVTNVSKAEHVAPRTVLLVTRRGFEEGWAAEACFNEIPQPGDMTWSP